MRNKREFVVFNNLLHW